MVAPLSLRLALIMDLLALLCLVLEQCRTTVALLDCLCVAPFRRLDIFCRTLEPHIDLFLPRCDARLSVSSHLSLPCLDGLRSASSVFAPITLQCRRAPDHLRGLRSCMGQLAFPCLSGFRDLALGILLRFHLRLLSCAFLRVCGARVGGFCATHQVGVSGKCFGVAIDGCSFEGLKRGRQVVQLFLGPLMLFLDNRDDARLDLVNEFAHGLAYFRRLTNSG
mmetsp:Transcript_93839/g.235615  ORF Transcript_93839/g.235615 Transcript_93839/m.235615 type:complete len:222 (+) Transcript_93839:728-1393(+)